MDASIDELLRFKNLVKIAINEAVDNLIGNETTEDHVRRIQVVYNQLLSNMTCVGDVVAEIFEKGKLTNMELESVQYHLPTPIRASDELLKLIMRKPRDVYECFLETLRKTQQHHVYQMLIATDECSDIDRQSGSAHSHLIRRHYAWLTEKMQPDLELLALLLQMEIITCREYEDIRSRKDVFKRSEMVLSIISRKSPEQFEKFKEVLNKTQQGHVAEKLRNTEEPGVLTDVKENRNLKSKQDANLKSASSNVNVIGKKPVEKPVPLPKPKLSKPAEEKPLISRKPKLVFPPSTAKRSQLIICGKLKSLENKLQVDLSIKVASVRERKMGSSDNFLKYCLQNILQESQNVKIELENKERSLTAVAELKEQERQINVQQQSELHLMRTKLAEEVRLKEEAESKRQQMHQQSENLKHEFQREVRDLKETLKQEATEYLNLKTTLENSESEHKKSRDQWNKQLTEEKERVKDLELKIVKIEQEREEEKKPNNSNQMESYEEHIERLSNDLDLLKSDNEELKNLLKQSADESEAARNKLKGMDDILAEKDKQMLLLREELASNKQSLDEITQSLTDYQKRYLDMENKVQDKVQLLEKENDALKKIKSDNIQYRSQPELTAQIKSTASKEKHCPIYGMTLLNEELFLLTKACSEIEVRDSILPETVKRRWKLTDLTKPFDMTSCSRNKCLYISDGIGRNKEEGTQRSLGHIFRVDPNGKLIKRWKTDLAGRLTVAHIENIFLTLEMEDAIIEYSPDGKRIRRLETGMHHPLHFLPHVNGNFLICHGGRGDSIYRVCVLDPAGNIIWSFPGKNPLEHEKLLIPLYLAVDRDGSVLVSDIANSRVVLLNSKLEFKRELVSEEDGLHEPHTMLLAESGTKLFVSDYGFDADSEGGYGRVLVYNIV